MHYLWSKNKKAPTGITINCLSKNLKNSYHCSIKLLTYRTICDIINAERLLYIKMPCAYANQRFAPRISANYTITCGYGIINAERLLYIKMPCAYANQGFAYAHIGKLYHNLRLWYNKRRAFIIYQNALRIRKSGICSAHIGKLYHNLRLWYNKRRAFTYTLKIKHFI